MDTITGPISEIIEQSDVQGNELKSLLSKIVSDHWPSLPPWTTLQHPVIEEVQKVTVGSGVVVSFTHNGMRKVVLGEAGTNYKWTVPSYTIPGGFINLTRTPGSSLVPTSDKPETARTGAAREVEEEFKNIDGTPLLTVDPARLKPMDSDTLLFPSGERRLVIGLMLELTAKEITRVRTHVSQLARSPKYKAAMVRHTINEASGKPEIQDVKIFNLADVAAGRVALLHKDQLSLFRAVEEHFREIDAVIGPKIKKRGLWPRFLSGLRLS